MINKILMIPFHYPHMIGSSGAIYPVERNPEPLFMALSELKSAGRISSQIFD